MQHGWMVFPHSDDVWRLGLQPIDFMKQSLSSDVASKTSQLNLNIWLNLLRERLEYLVSELKDDISTLYGVSSEQSKHVDGKQATAVLHLRLELLFKPDDMIRALQIMGPPYKEKKKKKKKNKHRIVWSTKRSEAAAKEESVIVLYGLYVNKAYWEEDAGTLVEDLKSTGVGTQLSRAAASTKGPEVFGSFGDKKEEETEKEKEEKEKEKEKGGKGSKMYNAPVVVGGLDVGHVLLNKGKVSDPEYWLRRGVHLSS